MKQHGLLKIIFIKGALIFLCMSIFTQWLQAQNQLVNLRGTFSMQNVFSELEKQTQLSVDYDESLIDRGKEIKLDIQDKRLSEALTKILKETSCTYLIKGSHLIITRRPAKVSSVNRVAGQVKDPSGETIVGASIVEKGTTRGTVTDVGGNFSMDVGGDAVLVVSSIGYHAQEIPVGNTSFFNIRMEGGIDKLDEVIVVGYGVQRKVTTTGAVAKVEGSELAKINVPNAEKTLQGLTSGITVVDRGGAPGDDNPLIFIRGVGTTGKASPLVLVDGIEMRLSQIPSRDIESISILKDAASASIYGSRAANGVILVTTKRGKTGRMELSYEGFYGLQNRAVKAKRVGHKEYIDMVNEASRQKGNSDIFADYNQPYVDYPSEVYKPTYITEHSVGLAGGTELGRYLMSFNFLDQPGLTANTSFKRYNYRVNTDVSVGDKLKVGSDLLYQHADRLQPMGLGTALGGVWYMVPTLPIRYANGNYTLDDQGSNPVASSDVDVTGRRDYVLDIMNGQVKADYSLLQELTLTGVASIKGTWTRSKAHSRNYRFYNHKNEFVREWNTQNGVSDTRNNSYLLTLRALANYKKRWLSHDVNVLLGAEQVSYRNYNSSAERKGLISDDMPDINLGDARYQYASGGPSMWGINSFFGRLNYGYRDRYLFEANIRRDGSSRFADGHKWGAFPSFSGAWRVSEEPFLKEVDLISNLKVRASWGQAGNEQIGEFLYLSTYAVDNMVMNGALQSGMYQKAMSNPNITWETVESTNLGLDFGLLGNSIFGEFDYYVKDTKDILLNLAIPKFIGLDAPWQNAGVVRNSGVELLLGYRKQKGEFTFSVSNNFSYNKNQWIDRASDNNNISRWTIQREGAALNSFYIFKADGLIANQADLDAYKLKHKEDPRGISALKPGDVKFVDVNNDGTIDANDRQVYTPNIPKFVFGLNFNANYKNFDLSLFFQGATGSSRYVYGDWYEGPSFQSFTGLHFLDRWTEQNQNPKAKVPRLESGSNRNIATYNSLYLRNNTYIRLKNVQLGYTVPTEITQKVRVERVRLYVSGSNMITLSGLDQGLDPEMYDGSLNTFPPLRIMSFGVSITF